MKSSPIVQALISLSLLCADGFPASEFKSPEIIGPDHVQIKAHPGGQLVLNCEAFANCEVDMTVIYWLVNDSFPEDTPSSGRMVESEESTLEDGEILQRSLLLKNVTSEDLKSTFTCVVTNAAGTAMKHTTLSTKRSRCNVGKNRKY
ncbi:interleukin-1 receptor type 2-like isoform X1 [Xyrichtys novacula]|uniref:Soluble interferon alpha/beta receptor OPG204 n=1 Tax=Xyrichtys novacula TaxID=13765 RepID=A0AAV1FTB8_XYRNO|nr:interleukin-1 receptor type 2-like isoform X1 [Xyrichtys novacula]